MTRRARYVIKYNGLGSWLYRKSVRRHCRANMGRGDAWSRVMNTAYECRFKGFYPKSCDDLHRMAGVP